MKPARENFYGGGLTLPVWEGGFLTLNGSQNKIRGNVNGNVLIPLAEERTPLSDDPELSSIVQTLLDSYPNEEPNRQDIADRAHNTNSLQLINTDTANIQLARIDHRFGNEGDFGRPERFSESFAIDPVQVE